MAIIVQQEPGYHTAPAGQELMFVINEDTGLLTSTTFPKIIANVLVANDKVFTDLVLTAQFKAAPNGAGVCMFDFGQIVENVLTPDYNGFISDQPAAFSTLQGLPYTENRYYHTIHNIDKYAYSQNSAKYFQVSFTLEFLGGDGVNNNVVAPNGMYAAAQPLYLFNGVLYDTDVQKYPSTLQPNNYGYDLSNYFLQTNSAPKGIGGFLTNSPKIQYATLEDYGTFAFFNNMNEEYYSFDVGAGNLNTIKNITIKLYDSSDSQIGTTITLDNEQVNGGFGGHVSTADDTSSPWAKTQLLYAGVFPANLRGWSTVFQTQAATGNLAYYTVQAINQQGDDAGLEYRINIVEECLYPPIRLTWLNKFGTWDYYTFMKKSTRSLKTTRKEYTKLRGTWNSSSYNPNQQSGGKKNYLIETNETIKVNTDYITEEEGVWLEELFNSQEMYIVNPYFTYSGLDVINKFLEPVNVTNTSYKRKTKLNDKLIQYSFDLKRVSNRKTQRP